MMSKEDMKTEIQTTLQACAQRNLAEASTSLLNALGYRSEKTYTLTPNTAEQFQAEFDPQGNLNAEKVLLDDWVSVDVLFQVTDDELRDAFSGQKNLLASSEVSKINIQSYLFFSVELKGDIYTRSQLAAVTREINKLLPMPVMVVFRYNGLLSLGIITRRVNKREASKDVLEKVTLIKDMRLADPHRAHIEILHDLSLGELVNTHALSNFVDLQRAWEKTLDTNELNKKFYKEVANWYFWAISTVKYPQGAGEDEETRNATSIIRLITRLIFVWFIKEKGVVPEALFDKRKLDALLNYEDPSNSTYYKAVLQNLFFATLNTEMGSKREFRRENEKGRDPDYLMASFYRYQRYFRDADEALKLFAEIPFLNGGLFECLDREVDVDGKRKIIRIDGFSDRDDNPLQVPDELFFCDECEIDLNEIYGTKNKRYKVRGLIDIFNSYKFTIEENTPIEEEIALDPELLGKVFENLLAAYNPETGTTARKQTGSFYTPREIVNYMVDEALIAYLETALTNETGDDDTQKRLRALMAYDEEPHGFMEDEVGRLIEAINNIKVLDPAAGSGAFPMGVLHKLVFQLAKLDPKNERWKGKQLSKAYEIQDTIAREEAARSIEEVFTENFDDYGRKLYLIENCIYGVDIQPIAVQIAKLRFFISLVVDQKTNPQRDNLGIRPLPNLETRFVAANTLVGIERPQQMMLRNPDIDRKEKELAEVRSALFTARTSETKRKYRALDKELRVEIADLLKKDGWGSASAAQLAGWDPYDQNASAEFFDPEWMFGVKGGFDIVIGNPPYVVSKDKKLKNIYKESVFGRPNLYGFFIHNAIEYLLNSEGILIFINPRTLLTDVYTSALRDFILNHSKIRSILNIVDRRNVFEAVLQSCIVNSFQKSQMDKPVNIKTIKSKEEIYDVNFIKVDLENFVFGFDESRTSFLVAESNLAYNIFKRLKTFSTFEEQGIKFTTGKIQWDLYKGSLSEFPENEQCTRLIWAENIQRYYFAESRNRIDKLYINSPLSTCEPISFETLIVQRTTAVEQLFRIIATKISPDTFGYPVQAENHTSYLEKNEKAFNPNYILALLNSKFMDFYFRHMNSNTQVSAGELNSLPFPLADKNTANTVSKLVIKILVAKRADSQADTSTLEGEIDQLVYELYGLTEDEVAIVEESQSKPQARTTKKKSRKLKSSTVSRKKAKSQKIEAPVVPEPDKEDAPEVAPSDYGLYKCENCGSMVMGFVKEEHVRESHGGKDVEWKQMG
jgi:adenine-specific DNA-methyltransferase